MEKQIEILQQQLKQQEKQPAELRHQLQQDV